MILSIIWYLQEQIENTITNLEKQTEELQKWIEKNSKLQEELDVDQLTEPKDPLKRQYISLSLSLFKAIRTHSTNRTSLI
jgi:cell shape-determining protein MreC